LDKVLMNDGLDGRETIAFGLVAGEIVALVLAMLSGYAVLHSGLAEAIAWSLAALLLAGGASLAWGRLAGRPLLEWCVLLAWFLVRTRHARAARLRTRWRRCAVATQVSALRQRGWRSHAGRRAAHSPRPLQAGAVNIPLALRHIADESSAATPVATPVSARRLAVVGAETPAALGRDGDGRRRSHVVGFFSLCGGTGRTTLAVEVAAMLAARGRAAAATGSLVTRVALLDLAERSPGVGLRLGIPPPPARADGSPTIAGSLVTHGPGLLVGLAPASVSPGHQPGGVAAETLIRAAEDRGADIVIVDVDCDLGARCVQALDRCDQVMVTLTPTAGGVLDAYRSTAIASDTWSTGGVRAST
jgi:hypothetical protein